MRSSNKLFQPLFQTPKKENGVPRKSESERDARKSGQLFSPPRYYSPMNDFRASSYSNDPSRTIEIARFSAMHKIVLPKQVRSSSTVSSLPKITLVLEPQPGKGAIFLGSLEGARDVYLLKSHKIGSVLSAIGYGATLQYDPKDIQLHKIIYADDLESYDISKHFGEAFEFIEKGRAETNVLVHCYAGVSRSVSLVVAYLMRANKWTLNRALEFVRKKRLGVQPNQGFMSQLKRFEGENFGILKVDEPKKMERKKIFS